jgi:O-methyltransferase
MNPIARIWEQFREKRITKQVLPFTLVGPERVHNLSRLAARIERERIPGDVIECGVCNGGTAAVLARSASRSRMNRIVWLLDSFQGMPEVTEHDGDAAGGDAASFHVGKEVGSEARVRSVLHLVGADMARVRIVPGWFQDTFPAVTASKVALLNIDADWYESVKFCLHTFYDRVAPGGFISIDDYGHWPGCRKAVDEFFHDRKLPYKLIQVDYTAHWFQKT